MMQRLLKPDKANWHIWKDYRFKAVCMQRHTATFYDF